MKTVGYPPGWKDPQALADHIFGGAGALAIYDTVAEAEAHGQALSSAATIAAPVSFPGYNAPLHSTRRKNSEGHNATESGDTAMDVEPEEGEVTPNFQPVGQVPTGLEASSGTTVFRSGRVGSQRLYRPPGT